MRAMTTAVVILALTGCSGSGRQEEARSARPESERIWYAGDGRTVRESELYAEAPTGTEKPYRPNWLDRFFARSRQKELSMMVEALKHPAAE